MSSRDSAAAAAIARVAVACDGAILGVALAVCAATSWVKYFASSSSLDRIRGAPSARISDLRSILQSSSGDGDGQDDCRLVVVRGQVLPKAPAESTWPASKGFGTLISQGSDERAVIVLRTQTVPFILMEGSHWPYSDYVHINLDESTHPLPLTTVYHQLRPIQPTPYTFFQAIFGNGYPVRCHISNGPVCCMAVAIWPYPDLLPFWTFLEPLLVICKVAILDEEKILPVGKELTAVGFCRMQNGGLEMKSCSDLPYFLSGMTKDEIEADLATNNRILFWSGIFLGTLSIGVLGYTIVRNWRRWKEWRQRRNQSQDPHQTAEIAEEQSFDSESGDAYDGDVPEGQLCVVCLMRQKRSAFIPCGHLVCCAQCAMYVQHSVSPKCPVCSEYARGSPSRGTFPVRPPSQHAATRSRHDISSLCAATSSVKSRWISGGDTSSSLRSTSSASMASISPVSAPLKFCVLPSSSLSPKTLSLWHLPFKPCPFRVHPPFSSSHMPSPIKSVSYDGGGVTSGLGFGFSTYAYASSSFSASSSPLFVAPPQTPATAMRGAESDVMGLLLRERIVFLGSSIDDFLADAIISQLLLLDAQDPIRDIRLFINSPGGSLSATMAIYDVVQLIRADVSTVALGIAASTSSVILGGGTKGKRLAMPNTRIMLHQPLGGASGQAIDVEIQAREIMHNKDNVTRIISGFTGRSFEQVQKDIDRDRYMSPIEAVEYGIIDGVIDRDSIIQLMPVPERVKPKYNYEEISKDPKKFLTPDIPDDEIY
ncbi:ATP-dependent Clp protease proteolytic subunit 4, chloroplastic [Apostasia shenzhenica]|uniref:Endopeptidase Clp n=1 Tax=Apostasia shenzhenica TaxID=1088818 RepID=A0A2I0B867_9ASPA|nr:ATP-dependent Clp protease proteolytic subunit 4, chloroplastic [Apostasia shenzhenica]